MKIGNILKSTLAAGITISLLAGTIVGGVSISNADDKSAYGEVLYEQNFDDVKDGALPDGWKTAGDLKAGKAYVKDGKLIIDASGINLGKVMLPDSLGQNGNYAIEADIVFNQVANETRWCSLIVRHQNTEEDYYQMAVRSKTSSGSGVEFAVRSPNSWNVVANSTYDKNPGVGNEFHMKISIFENSVNEYINDKLVLSGDYIEMLTSNFSAGKLGIQANQCVISVDNVKVTKLLKATESNVIEEYHSTNGYVEFETLKTKLINAPTNIAIMNSMEDVEAALAAKPKPQVAFFYVDETLNVTDEKYQINLGKIGDIVAKLDTYIIPAFYAKNETSALALGQYLKDNKVFDSFIVCENEEDLNKARDIVKKNYGAWDLSKHDFGEVTDKSLYEIVEKANANQAKTVIIPESVATKHNVEYLQKHIINVWVKESAEKDNNAMLHNSIQSGANGIVTDSFAALYDAFEFYSKELRVLVRNPLVIGHRGLPSAGPENTIASADEAIAAAVDIIEMDIRLSKDNVVYNYHDGDLSSLTTGSGTIDSKTSSELDKIIVKRSSGYGEFSKYPKEKLPRLEDYFKKYKGKPVMFFVEIKEEKEKLLEETARLVEKYDIADQIVFISFSMTSLRYAQKYMPGISCGFLASNPSGKHTSDLVKSITGNVARYNTAFDPQGIASTALIKALMARGIQYLPWTFVRDNTSGAYLQGATGITTDTCDEVSYAPTDINIGGNYKFALDASKKQSITFSPKITCRMGNYDLNQTYEDGTKVNQPELVIIDGADIVKVEGDSVTLIGEGTAHLMYKYVAFSNQKTAPAPMSEYTIYSQVITVTSTTGGEDIDGGYATTPGKTDDTSGKSGCFGIITGAGSILAIALTGVIVLRKKENH